MALTGLAATVGVLKWTFATLGITKILSSALLKAGALSAVLANTAKFVFPLLAAAATVYSIAMTGISMIVAKAAKDMRSIRKESEINAANQQKILDIKNKMRGIENLPFTKSPLELAVRMEEKKALAVKKTNERLNSTIELENQANRAIATHFKEFSSLYVGLKPKDLTLKWIEKIGPPSENIPSKIAAKQAFLTLKKTEQLIPVLREQLKIDTSLAAAAVKRKDTLYDLDQAERTRTKFATKRVKLEKTSIEMALRQRRLKFELYSLDQKRDERKIVAIREASEVEIASIKKARVEYEKKIREDIAGIEERAKSLKGEDTIELFRELMAQRKEAYSWLADGITKFDKMISDRRIIGYRREKEAQADVLKARKNSDEREAKKKVLAAKRDERVAERKKKLEKMRLDGLFNLDNTLESIAYRDLRNWVTIEAEKLRITKKRIFESLEYQRKLESIYKEFDKDGDKKKDSATPRITISGRMRMFGEDKPQLQIAIRKRQLSEAKKSNVNLAKIDKKMDTFNKDSVDKIVLAIERTGLGGANYG